MSDAVMTPSERDRLVSLLTESRAATLDAVERLTDEQWSFRAGDGRWTVGEILEHLNAVELALFNRVTTALTRKPNPEWQTATAGKTELIERHLSDRSSRREAPQAVVPTGRHDRSALVGVYQDRRHRSLRFVTETTDPIKAHTAEHQRPGYGTLNAYQWLLFIAFHNFRHIEQMAELTRSSDFPAGGSPRA